MGKSEKINSVSGYGPPVLSNGWVKTGLKYKNIILTRFQYKILKHFGSLGDNSKYARLFSSVARKMIGSYIYSIKLEVNDMCTLSCEMCYVPKRGTEMPLEWIRSLLGEIKSCGIRLELLGGEPLLRKDIVEIVRLSKKYAGIPHVSIYTNGIYASEEVARDLKSAGLDSAIVTLVSADSETHDRFTGTQGSWDQTIRGIQNLNSASLNTYTFTAIHRKNAGEIKNIHNFVKEELKAHPLFYQYIPQKKDDNLIINNELWYELKNWVLKMNSDHSRFVRDFYMLTGNACSGGNFVLTVKADGTVQPCPFISDIPLGHIKTTDIWSIYKNRYKSNELYSFKSLPESCKICTYSSVCGGGCRAGNKSLSLDYLSSDYRCLGPYSEKINKNRIMDVTPCFF
jgi:radical SAM protein with 4Fe4S-binding SPASM domain